MVFTIPSARAVQTNSVGAIVCRTPDYGAGCAVRFGLDCDPQDLNLPRPALESQRSGRREVMPILIISAACRT